MRQETIMLGIGALALCTSAATAQVNWVTYSNQTGQRLVASASVGSGNVDEKDYDFGDLDADGDIDLVAVYKQPFTFRGTRRNVLFMNEGISDGQAINGVLVDRSANFAPQFLELTNDRDVAVVDLNGDGWLDVVTATTLSGDPAGTNGNKNISHPRVYINQGQANGQPHASGLSSQWLGLEFDDGARIPLQPTEPRFCSVSYGDVDNDGDMDLYFGDYQQGGGRTSDLDDRLWINNGNGYFTDESVARMTGEMRESSFGMATEMADMNNDGFVDIIKDDALNAPQAVSVSYNNPASPGNFNLYQLASQQQPYHVVVGNLNNDNLKDMVITDDFDDIYRLGTSISNGRLNFSSAQEFEYNSGGDDGFGGDNYIADLDNDGYNDVLIADVDVDIGGNDGCSDGRRGHIFRNMMGVDGTPNGGTPRFRELSSGGQSVSGISFADLQGVHDFAVFDINGDSWLDIVVGTCFGTKVFINVPPDGVLFTYPGGLPELMPPDAPLTFQVQLQGDNGGQPDPGTGRIHLSINGGPYAEIPMNHLGGNLYEATLAAADCADTYRYFFSADSMAGGEFFDPPGTSTSPHLTLVANGISIELEDRMEGDVSAWTITNQGNLTSGEWEVAVPVAATTTSGSNLQAAPGEDAGDAPDTMAFVTQNGNPGQGASLADIDGGTTILTSPTFDLAGADGFVSYDRWMFTEGGTLDSMHVQISNDNGANWVTLENANQSSSLWVHRQFQVSDFVAPTAQMRVRFSIGDNPNDSVTEGGLDNFKVDILECDPEIICLADTVGDDFNPPGDGMVDGFDLAFLLGEWGRNPGSPADMVGEDFLPPADGKVDGFDLAFMLGEWGACD